MISVTPLADRVDALLPQTQCTQCGYDGCRPYAEAIAAGDAAINQCPPGGARGIDKLAQLLGRTALPLNPLNGVEKPLRVAIIDETRCIGCTLCIQACPVDAIMGAPRRMHSVLPHACTGCDLCVPPCPMDCIAMVPVDPPRDWSEADATRSRERMYSRRARLAQEEQANNARLLAKAQAKLNEFDESHELHDLDPVDDVSRADSERKRAVVSAAVERARARRAQLSAKP